MHSLFKWSGFALGVAMAFWICVRTRVPDSNPVEPMRPQTAPGESFSSPTSLDNKGQQLSYSRQSNSPGEGPEGPSAVGANETVVHDVPHRRIPGLVRFAELLSPQLTNSLVPLPQANTLAHVNFAKKYFGRLQTESGEIRHFNPEVILVKPRGQQMVAALRVEPMKEWDAVRLLKGRTDTEFAELDIYQQRQFISNDLMISNQWHHFVIGSFDAWNTGWGQNDIRLAIVDTPFQMDHPDLAGNVVPGWDVVENVPVLASSGIAHSTMCAGLASGLINNGLGIAGIARCKILPININGAISEMYNAVIWAADHGVRVVNMSWTGGNSDTLQAAAAYLKTNAQGVLVMPGENGIGFLNYKNQPDIVCVSMTDAADNLQSKYGPHIDVAAPGWQVFSTTIGGGYASGTGTSYATPLVSGLAAWVFSLNPNLTAEEVIRLIQESAKDLGPAGQDWYFGAGRINFAALASATAGTLPQILSIQRLAGRVTVSATYIAGLRYSLWRSQNLNFSAWEQVPDAVVVTNNSVIELTDPAPLSDAAFYRLQTIRH